MASGSHRGDLILTDRCVRAARNRDGRDRSPQPRAICPASRSARGRLRPRTPSVRRRPPATRSTVDSACGHREHRTHSVDSRRHETPTDTPPQLTPRGDPAEVASAARRSVARKGTNHAPAPSKSTEPLESVPWSAFRIGRRGKRGRAAGTGSGRRRDLGDAYGARARRARRPLHALAHEEVVDALRHPRKIGPVVEQIVADLLVNAGRHPAGARLLAVSTRQPSNIVDLLEAKLRRSEITQDPDKLVVGRGLSLIDDWSASVRPATVPAPDPPSPPPAA